MKVGESHPSDFLGMQHLSPAVEEPVDAAPMWLCQSRKPLSDVSCLRVSGLGTLAATRQRGTEPAHRPPCSVTFKASLQHCALFVGMWYNAAYVFWACTYHGLLQTTAMPAPWRIGLRSEPGAFDCYEEAPMPCYVIRRMRLAHCKRGPGICEECRAMDVEHPCLLDVCPPREGEIQRRVIRFEHDEQETWREFDIVRVFDDELEALRFAREHGIEDIEL